MSLLRLKSLIALVFMVTVLGTATPPVSNAAQEVNVSPAGKPATADDRNVAQDAGTNNAAAPAPAEAAPTASTPTAPATPAPTEPASTAPATPAPAAPAAAAAVPTTPTPTLPAAPASAAPAASAATAPAAPPSAAPPEPATVAPAAPAAHAEAVPAVAPKSAEPNSVAPTEATPTVAREQRLALVIGNSKYKESPLPNPANDARAMSIKLKQLGFTVIEKENAGREEMVKSAREFGNQLKLGGVGLFYYAGHGIQANGVNYLVPVDADIQDEDELPSRGYDANEVLGKMDSAKNRLNIVILDACRNNPFARTFRSATRGLAQMQQGTGTIIAYATQPGNTAADGSSGNGLYTAELLQALSAPGLRVEEVFKQVRMEVSKKSGGQQVPWENSSLMGDFYFNPTTEQAATIPVVAMNYAPMIAASQAREMLPVLLSRKLFENYQLAANLPLSAAVSVGKLTPDGGSLLTVTQDKQLKIWNVGTGNVALTRADFGSASLSADGRYLIGLADDHAINLLDTEAKSPAVRTYRVGNDLKLAVVSPDGRRLLVYTGGRGFLLLNTDSAAIVGEARQVEGDPQYAFSPTGNRVLLWGSKNSDLFLLDLESGKRIGRTSAHRKAVGLARFSNDGNLLLTAAAEDSAIVWRTSDGVNLVKFSVGEGNPLPSQGEFIDDGTHLLLYVRKSANTADAGYKLGVWDMTSGKPLATVLQDVLIKGMRFSADRQRLYLVTSDASTRVIDLATKAQVDTLSGAELVGFSTDGRRLLARDADGIRLYDTQSLRPVARMPGQISAFVGPKTRNVFATAASDGSVRLWEFEHGDPVGLLKGHIDPVSVVSFAADGKQLVSFSDDRVAKLWALPAVQDIAKLTKDSYESTTEYQKRVADWSSAYTTLVALGEYNADSETYAVRVGDFSISVPMPRDQARNLAGQREAILTGRLKVYDADQLQLAESKLSRIP
jgi:WD40 repeat protein